MFSTRTRRDVSFPSPAMFCNFAPAGAYHITIAEQIPGGYVKRYAFLYLATFVVLIPLDFLFLGTIAKSFFQSQVGDMLGEVRIAPAILFYLLYIVGILMFVNGSPDATWQSTLLYGALFGFFCYATFELTSLSLLKHWTWPVVMMDISWGTFVTATSAALGLLLANWIGSKV
jgi:uncharacterized membrane protein